MKTYDLYLESGPQMKTTYVHVPALLGCVLNGATTQAALDATPGAIRTYLAFMERAGESVDPSAQFATRVVDHDMSGGFLGSRFLPTDTKPLSPREAAMLMDRLAALHGELRALTAGLSSKQLAAQPAKGRPIRRILTHVCAEGGYLRRVPGASRIQREADEGKIDPHEALDRLHALEVERLRSMDAAERTGVVMRGQNPWSARAAVRRMLEHAWEHYVEISVRLGREP
jgi:predicted RNase H-like HicB family nuclease